MGKVSVIFRCHDFHGGDVLTKIRQLTFREPDSRRFPGPGIVRTAAAAGGTRLAALSAADEVAVRRFLAGELRFTDIAALDAAVAESAPDIPCDSFENVMAADAAARRMAEQWKP